MCCRVQRFPQVLGGRRHIDMFDALLVQSVDDRIDHRWRRAHRAGLARALYAERVGLAGGITGRE